MDGSVNFSTPKIVLNNAERDYQERKSQALRQADGNPFTGGIQMKPSETEKEMKPSSPEILAPPVENNLSSDAIDRRLDVYSKALGNSELNLNDHSNTTRIQ